VEAGGVQRTVVFILSKVRSGSTWLSYVLGSHPGIAHLGEYHRPFERPGHVACRLCEARGRSECEILHGIENVPKQYAHDFAFERFRKPILCDASKSLEWTATFLDQDRFQVKAIHLMRDPRAWFASQRRREPLAADVAVQRWVVMNDRISDFVMSRRIPCCSVFYDDLAVRPGQYFPPLFRFVGSCFESRALEYWNYEHHGLGGNGAALNVIGKYERARVITGDDPFYQAHSRKHFHDTRWLAELSGKERRAFEQSAAISSLLARYSRDFAHFDDLLAESTSKPTANSQRESAARTPARGHGLVAKLAGFCRLW
jgi:hypothetical protein